jgi:hypothetical protein
MYFCGCACHVSRRAARRQESAGARCWGKIALLLACGRVHHRRPASPASFPRYAGGPQRAMSAQQRPPRTRAGGDSRGLCESILRKAKPVREAHRILWLVTHGAAAIVVVQARSVGLLFLLGRCLLHRCRAPSRAYVKVAWRLLVNFDEINILSKLISLQISVTCWCSFGEARC